MNTPNDRADHQLDTWLAAARTALDTALNEQLDLDAGLADAQLPARHTALTHALDDILDLDAGLAQIIPTHHQPSPPPDPTPPPAPTGRHTALGAFADRIAALPLPNRLSARTWLPLPELAHLQSNARRRLDLDRQPDRALERVLGSDLARDLARTRALERARDLTRALERDLARALDLVFDRDLTRPRDLARDLARVLARARARDLDLALDLARDLARVLAFARALERVLDLARARAHAHDLYCVLDLAAALDRTHDLTHELVEAVDRIHTAITNMADADLAQLDLTGIPLDGLRWSDRTRWPERWREHIQDNSIVLQPGLYEIRFGGVASTHTIDTPT